ncbi:MAG: serine hydrolase domain-containing protein [Chloroflexota bacterium]
MNTHTQIEQKIQSAIAEKSILGLSIAIIQAQDNAPCEVVYTNGFGTTSAETETALPITPNTLFSLGITSRTLTTVMVLRLVEQGLLALDRPVVDYLPGYVFHDNPVWGRQLTLQHLLTETTGLGSGGKGWGESDGGALERWAWDSYAHFRFMVAPGTVPNHGNSPTMAAYLAETVTGKHFTQLMDEQVFTPLGMTRTTYDRAVAMTRAVALDHEQIEDGTLTVKHRFLDNLAGNPDFMGLSSAHDLANVVAMLLDKGTFAGKQILLPETVAMMTANQASYGIEHSSEVRRRMEAGEGMGCIVGEFKGVPCMGRPAVHGQAVSLDLFPGKGLGVVCLTNYSESGKHEELVYEIYDALLETPATYHFAEPPTPVDEGYKDLWPHHVGQYMMEWGEMVKLWVADDQLFVEYEEEPYPLVPVNTHEYYFLDGEGNRQVVTMLPEPSGATQVVVAVAYSAARVELAPDFTPDTSGWQKYVGAYLNYHDAYSTIGYYVSLHEEKLTVTGTGSDGRLRLPTAGEGDEMTQIGPNRFVCYTGLFDFTEEDGELWVQTDHAFRYRHVPDYKGSGWKI